MRIGMGYDVHRLVEGRKLVLGGVTIPFEKGLLGHSDADVLVHAVCDALLGAAGLGDIGLHFPDTDSEYKDIASIKILAKTYELISAKGFSLSWMASNSQVGMHRPQPMHLASSMRATSSSVMASIWHCSTQVPQAVQSSSFIAAK